MSSAADEIVRPRMRLIGRQSDGTVFDPPPFPLTPLVGRERVLHDIQALLARPGVRLCTLTGPGGIGKTRLAIQAAHDGAADFPDGVAWVSLAPLTAPALVVPAIADAIGVRGPGSLPILERVARALEGRQALLVLDNFEHLPAAAPALAQLLQAAPELTLLITSRTPLHLSGEYEFAVPPLSVSDSPADCSSGFPGSPALALFEARTQLVRHGFTIDASNRTAVLEICRRLEGIPLAIELAAARGKTLSPGALCERLMEGLDLLAGGPIDQPARHRTMRAAIQWSYDLLPPAQQALFAQLAVFAGGFDLEGAAAVADGCSDDPGLFENIAELVDASMLASAPPGANQQPRFQMLEPIRQFGLERLAVSTTGKAVSERFGQWGIALAERAAAAFTGDGPGQWSSVLLLEIDNFRSALTLLDSYRAHERTLELATALEFLWSALGYQREGLQWLTHALDRTHGSAPPARILHGSLVAARLANAIVDFPLAERLASSALDLATTLDERSGIAGAECVLGNLARGTGDRLAARAYYERALAIYRERGDQYFTGYTLIQLAKLGDLGSPEHPGNPDDLAAAERMSREALSLYRILGNRWGIARALNHLSYLRYKQRKFSESAQLAGEALAIFQENGNLSEGSQSIENLADIAGARGDAELAVTLYGVTEGLRERLGTPIWPSYLVEYERDVSRARAALPAETFAAAWGAGRELPESTAVALALDAAKHLCQSAANHNTAALHPRQVPLSQREVEVLRMVATGASNQAIADALFISVTTVKGHVKHIMRKLDLDSRTALAAYAVRHGFDASS